MLPFQVTVPTTPGSTGAGVQVLTDGAVGRSDELDLHADRRRAPARGRRTATARRAPTNTRVRLVPVSSCGAPGSCGPGAGVSSAFGAGGGGGRIATERDAADLAPPAVMTATGPVTAPIGTRAWMRVSLPERTFDLTSSELPALPMKTTPVASPSSSPVIFDGAAALGALAGGALAHAGDLARPRACRRTRLRRRFRPERPLPPVPSARRHEERPRRERLRAIPRDDGCLAKLLRPLFLRPTGLADGLALKEQRYGRFGTGPRPIRPSGDLFDGPRTVPPFPGGGPPGFGRS